MRRIASLPAVAGKGAQVFPGNRQHAVAECRQSPDQISPDTEPDDQEGTHQAQNDDPAQDIPVESLHRRRLRVRFLHLGIGAVDQKADGVGQECRQPDIDLQQFRLLRRSRWRRWMRLIDA